MHLSYYLQVFAAAVFPTRSVDNVYVGPNLIGTTPGFVDGQGLVPNAQLGNSSWATRMRANTLDFGRPRCMFYCFLSFLFFHGCFFPLVVHRFAVGVYA